MRRKRKMLIAFFMTVALVACNGQGTGNASQSTAAEWTREGFFQDENENWMSVTYMDDVDEPGWYAGCTLGEDLMEDSWGGMLAQEGKNLKGKLPSNGSKEDITVTVSEEGEDGIMLVVEGGETYHFTKMDMPEATISVSVNTEGSGNIDYAEGETAPEIDTEYPYQSAVINLKEPALYTLTAWPQEGWHFVKWTKDGDDYSTEATITAELDESAEYIAVFEAGIDYLALVNKLNPLPEGWEDALETVTVTNSVGDEVEVEKKAYDAYLLLKEDMEVNDGIYLELDSARRSVAEQQRIMDSFTDKYGLDYALKTVAQPGYSEHHTGLALDLYFKLKNEDGTFTDVYYNEDMVQYPELWEKIHAKLADYGFILRYLEGREHITGYGYEPWHIRYVDDVDIAKEIMSKDITFEEYLGAVNSTDVTIDYGDSAIFSQEELEEAVIQIKCKFASLEGYELHSIRYAGDDASNEDNLKKINETNPDAGYVQVAEFLMDCYNADKGKDNTGYPWWLGRTVDDTWEIVSRGD